MYWKTKMFVTKIRKYYKLIITVVILIIILSYIYSCMSNIIFGDLELLLTSPDRQFDAAIYYDSGGVTADSEQDIYIIQHGKKPQNQNRIGSISRIRFDKIVWEGSNTLILVYDHRNLKKIEVVRYSIKLTDSKGEVRNIRVVLKSNNQ